MTVSSEAVLHQALEAVPSLKAVFVTAMPDCLLFLSWERDGQGTAAEDIAAYFGDLIRANRQGLKALGTWSEEMHVTIEADQALVVLRELGTDFVVSFVFDRASPLGMIRLNVRQLVTLMHSHLPKVEATERPRAIRVIEFLLRYAPDPHMALQRVALRTGVELERLERPEGLESDETSLIEQATCDILGLESLGL